MQDIDLSAPVDDIMRKWPGTIRAFLDHRMNCPGCPIGCFHTVKDACREHHVEMDVFVGDMKRLAVTPPDVSPCPRPA